MAKRDPEYNFVAHGNVGRGFRHGRVLPPNVELRGPLGESDKFSVLANARILIFTSRNEGQPLVLLEAMSVGLPVIAYDVGLIAELLGEDFPFLVGAPNKVELQRTFERAMDADLSKMVGANLQKRYSDFYSPGRHHKRLIEIFNNLREE